MFFILRYKPMWPNSIIVAILGILFGYASVKGYLPFQFETVGTKYPGLSSNLFLVPDLAALASQGPFATLPRIAQIRTLFNFSAVIAFVVILETLISAKIADGMTKTKFRQRREVLGVGLANIVSGAFGGLPASGVFARTALNVKTGARSSYSQIINAVTVAVISVVFLSGFNYLPLSITASILVYAAIRMVAAEHFKKLFRFDKTAFGLAMVVAGLTVVFDATTGILVGTLAALLIFARKLSQIELGSVTDPENFNPEEMRERGIIYRFAGELTYINSKSHIERINLIEASKPIILSFRRVYYIDVDGYESLDEMMETLERRGQKVFVTGVRPEMLKYFNEHTWFRKLNAERRVLLSTDEALDAV